MGNSGNYCYIMREKGLLFLLVTQRDVICPLHDVLFRNNLNNSNEEIHCMKVGINII